MAQNNYNLANQYNQQNLQTQQMENDRYQQMTPLMVRQQQLQNTGTDITNQTNQTKLDEANRDWQVRQGVPIDQETQAKISSIAAKMSEDQLAQYTAKLQGDALSTDPKIRSRALYLMQGLQSFQLEKAKQAAETSRAIATVRAQGEEQRKLEDQEAAHGKYLKSWNTPIDIKIRNAADPIQRETLIQGAISDSKLAGDQESVAKYTQMFNDNLPLANQARQVKGIAALGKLDMAGTTGMPGVQVPQGQPLPVPGVPQPQPAPQAVPSSQLIPGTQPTPNGVPRPGEVRKGYRFKGGNPGDKNNWEKVS
jgi:hypothetical protein